MSQTWDVERIVSLKGSPPLEMIKFLQNRGLLAKSVTCECGGEMNLNQSSESIDHFKWRCINKACKKKRSVRTGSWFEKSKLSFYDILKITYFWSRRYPPRIALQESNKTEHTICDWFNFCREVCVEVVCAETQQIGGVGRIVEINESKFGKRKYNRGKHVDGDWVFGGIERETNKCFMRIVEDRSAETLLKIIKECIAPGTTIISDCWKAYSSLENEGFRHFQLNHSVTFTHTKTGAPGAHSNTIEGMWSCVKRMFPDAHRSQNMFESYLAQFMYTRLRQNETDKFDAFLNDISKVYPL